MALVKPEYIDSITTSITREYLEALPELRDKFSIHICESANGAKFNNFE